jgi:hypothetical protein
MNGGRDIMTIQRPDERDTVERAYALWEARGRPIGSPQQDWFDAETQLRAELDDIGPPKTAADALAQETAYKLMDDVVGPDATNQPADRTEDPPTRPSHVVPELTRRPKGQRKTLNAGSTR